MALKCIAPGCMHEARQHSNYCATCWRTRISPLTRERRPVMASARRVDTRAVFIAMAISFACALAYLASIAKCN